MTTPLASRHPSISGLPEIVFSMQVGSSRLARLASLAPQDDGSFVRHAGTCCGHDQG
jgi:hypothetical protein